MNGDITMEEIKQIIKKMKNKKAPRNDSIVNEAIKCSDLWQLSVDKIGETLQQNLWDRLLSKFLEWGAKFLNS